jgi:hypothetical protein
MPFAFPFAYALGLAMMERVAPLAIDTFVNELAAEFQREPEFSLGDRVVVFLGRRRTIRHEPAVILGKVLNKDEYNVKLANDDIVTVAQSIMRREDYDRVAEVVSRPVT